MPDAFDYFKSQDADFELVTSPTLQPLRLMYNYNKVTKKIAYVFVNSGCLEEEYKNSDEKGAEAYRLFDDVLEFDYVQKFRDLSSEKMRKVFNQINEEVKEFQAQIDERNNKYKSKGIENHELAWKKTVEDIFDETLKKK